MSYYLSVLVHTQRDVWNKDEQEIFSNKEKHTNLKNAAPTAENTA
jgi:hypothetical protein